MIHVDLHDDAKADLLALALVEPDAVATISVFLQEAKAIGDRVADVLTTTGNIALGTLKLSVKPWTTAQRQRSRPNVWRLRVLESPATSYRLIHGYNYQTKQLVVLAVLRKTDNDKFEADFDYDNLETPIARRILAAWDALG